MHPKEWLFQLAERPRQRVPGRQSQIHGPLGDGWANDKKVGAVKNSSSTWHPNLSVRVIERKLRLRPMGINNLKRSWLKKHKPKQLKVQDGLVSEIPCYILAST